MKFDFSQNYVLQNDRMILEPLSKNHLEKLKPLAEEKEIWTYFLGASDGSRDFERYLLDAIELRKKKEHYAFAVFDKVKNSYAGCTRYFGFDLDMDVVRIGYTWYGKNFRGTGLNRNCKFLMFQFAFEQMGTERIGLGAHAENKVSIAAMKSVGLKQEGRIRNAFPAIHKTGREDAVLLGMIKEEWFDTIKNNLNQRL